MRSILIHLPAVFAIMVLGVRAAAAQPAPDGTATGTGRAIVKRQPDLVRMQLELTAEGKDAKEAMGKLKEKQSALAEKLKGLGATEGSVVFGDPMTGTGGSQRQQQMAYQRMMMTRNNRGGGAPTSKPSAPQGVTVSMSVKADWPIDAKTPEDALVAGYGIVEKLKASDIVKKEAKTLTPEEAEQLEEMQGMDPSGQQQAPGEARFTYVSKIPEEQRAAAMAAAFKKAKDSATRLAKAAGADLGTIKQLTSQTLPGSPDGGDGMENQYAEYVSFMRQVTTAAPPDSDEAIGNQPGTVSLQVIVSAAFALK